MNPQIRPMLISDIDDVYAIEVLVHIAPWSKDIIRDCVLVGYDCQVLELNTESNHRVIGYIISRHADNQCHILNFCITKDLQVKGYGRNFLNFFLHSLSRNELLHAAVLEVRPSNKVALHLYESLGFTIVEIKKGYYKDTNQPEDAILLKLNL